MTPIELSKALDGVVALDNSLLGKQVLGISTNSKEIGPGFIFIAISGAKFDGNDFINEALLKGAVCVISDSKHIEQTNEIISNSGAPSGYPRISTPA